MKKIILMTVACAGVGIFAAQEWFVTVDPSVVKGPIKLMNAVNNGPTKPRSDQSKGNFDEYAALKIPYARIHDANHCSAYGGPHTVDISAVFPNWDADETKPESYDFVCTDEYLANIRAAGTEPYYRLGQSIEHYIKKYHVHPPKDNAKWARICEHIVRHYNEGWANGFRWNIRYWEIWNEPDGNQVRADGRQGPTWTGTTRQFLDLYKETSLHLRKCFGETIKIGGPAFCWWGAWEKDFVPFCAKEKLPLDFYSWHCYYKDATTPAENARRARKLLDDNGFTKTESHLNEWNYVRGWGDEWIYSLECESGRLSQKGAASIAAVMIACQEAPLDLLMFYDARIGCGMNNMFDQLTSLPKKGYYPFFAWRRLRELGTQVQVTVKTKDVKKPQLFACAAKNAAGRTALFLARYSDDNNIVETRKVTISLPKGTDYANARCHITDAVRTYTETPLVVNANGTASLKLQPNSFALIEF
ncbi:MAG: hypothetical protein ACI4RA_07405 [Kiritimatiellia bacterium]